MGETGEQLSPYASRGTPIAAGLNSWLHLETLLFAYTLFW